MAAVVFSANQQSGPGFASDEDLLNVMINHPAKVGFTTGRGYGGDGDPCDGWVWAA
jgi:hypothetical protein